MNQSAQVSGVKALSDDERAGHIKAINEHRTGHVPRCEPTISCGSSVSFFAAWPIQTLSTASLFPTFYSSVISGDVCLRKLSPELALPPLFVGESGVLEET
jgi:hypothetical protein